MAFLGQEEQLRELQERFRYLQAVVVISIAVLVSRLVFLQILKGEQMRLYSEENRIKRVTVEAPRGMIFDRSRTLLVDNQPSFDLEITPQYLRESKKEEQVLKKLAELIKIPVTELRDRLNKASDQASYLPIKIKTELTRDEVALLETWRISMPGVAVRMEIKRTNLYGDVASHLLGYVSKVNQTELAQIKKENRNYALGDKIGKSGTEKQLEEVLRGVDGHEIVEVDALGRRVRSSQRADFLTRTTNPVVPARPGKNLILTIDQDLQMAAVKAFGDNVGGVVAIDPRNGEILAMISRPGFDPTEFSRGIAPELWSSLTNNKFKPLRDKTIQDHYPPGSVFKVVTAIAALKEETITLNTRFTCTGSITLGKKIYHCWRKGGHGDLNVLQALTGSCDVFFYRVAQKLKSVNLISKWAYKLGLGRMTGIDLPREVPGLIPTEEWKMAKYGQEWTAGESMTVAIGQSFVLATTIQLANLYAAIANGGTLFQPHYLKAMESYDGKSVEEYQARVMDQVSLTPDILSIIKRGLLGVVNSEEGTAHSQKIEGIDFAGKTGTVQVIRIAAERVYDKCQNMKYEFRHHGLFAGFAPADNPLIAVAVVAEHACSGSRGAAPIGRAVVKTFFEKYHPELLKKDKNPVANAAHTETGGVRMGVIANE